MKARFPYITQKNGKMLTSRLMSHMYTVIPGNTHIYTCELRNSDSKLDSWAISVSTIERSIQGIFDLQDLSALFITIECESTLIPK